MYINLVISWDLTMKNGGFPWDLTKKNADFNGIWIYVMWVKQCHKPPMTGNGKHTTYKNGDGWGMVYSCFHPHV